jgi:uncharacterized protein (DUF433 family)
MVPAPAVRRLLMATTSIRDLPKETLDALVDHWIVPDPYKPGRHNAVIRNSRTHVWAIIAELEGLNWDIAATAESRELPEEAIRAALAYRERHSALFDAEQLLREEEWKS